MGNSVLEKKARTVKFNIFGIFPLMSVFSPYSKYCEDEDRVSTRKRPSDSRSLQSQSPQWLSDAAYTSCALEVSWGLKPQMLPSVGRTRPMVIKPFIWWPFAAGQFSNFIFPFLFQRFPLWILLQAPDILCSEMQKTERILLKWINECYSNGMQQNQ